MFLPEHVKRMPKAMPLAIVMFGWYCCDRPCQMMFIGPATIRLPNSEIYAFQTLTVLTLSSTESSPSILISALAEVYDRMQ